VNTVQKIGVLIVATGMITAATLPNRQTPQVINAIKNLFSGSLHTAITGNA
jgi:hypothetical protein